MVDPDYLYYVMQDLYSRGRFKEISYGTLSLKHLRVTDIRQFGIGPRRRAGNSLGTIGLPSKLTQQGLIDIATSGAMWTQGEYMPLGFRDENGEIHLVGLKGAIQLVEDNLDGQIEIVMTIVFA